MFRIISENRSKNRNKTLEVSAKMKYEEVNLYSVREILRKFYLGGALIQVFAHTVLTMSEMNSRILHSVNRFSHIFEASLKTFK